MTDSPATHRASTHGWRRTRVAQVAGVILAASGLVVASTVTAAADVTTYFELDGNVLDGASAAPDWSSLFTAAGAPASSLPTGFVSANFFKDFTAGSTADTTTYATGSKDTLDITPGWQCKKSNNVTDKGDIQNTYMAPYRAANGHLVIFAGLEKNAPNGDNNMAVWLLKDGTVACTGGGGNTPFTGRHQNDDTLLVAAFLNGGSNPVVNAYQWQNGALNQTPLGTGHKCGTTGSENLCAITNETAHVTTPWQTSDKILGDGTELGNDQFYEMGADLTALGINDCFANYIANTRSSQSLTATLYDYAGGSAPTCGSLSVHKYIDVDKSGTNNTNDVTSGTAVAGWAFTVAGPSPATTTVCSGTTDNTGTLVCSTGGLSNLTPGNYTVTETQQTGFFATDPGGTGTFNVAVSPSKTNIAVTFNGGSVDFGNTCFVDKTFRVTGVPNGHVNLEAHWTKTSGDGTAASGTVQLTDAGNTTLNDGIYQGTLSDVLAQNAHISWSWNNTGVTTGDVTGATDESLATSGYPTCAKTNSVAFPFATLNGTKYKDVNHNGTNDTGDLAGGGFHFQLMQGTTQIGSDAISDSSGNYSFSNVAPGTYTVHEVVPTGWVQTEPVTGSPPVAADRSVTVALGDTSKTIGAFGNTPKSNISVTFTSQAQNPGTTTDSTQAAITCKDAALATVGSQTGNTATANNLLIGTYTCTVVITDP
jgi:SdrD B-like domain